MSKLILVLGGTRSGKSDFAQNLASESANVSYIATAHAADEEMKQRIEKHKKNRPKEWQTIELGNQSLDTALNSCGSKTVIIDCLGNLIARAHGDSPSLLGFLPGKTERGCPLFIDEIAKTINNNKDQFEQIIIVSNEVGLSLVSTHKSGRDFSDAIGLLNQKIADIADEAYLLIAGQPLRIK